MLTDISCLNQSKAILRLYAALHGLNQRNLKLQESVTAGLNRQLTIYYDDFMGEHYTFTLIPEQSTIEEGLQQIFNYLISELNNKMDNMNSALKFAQHHFKG